MNFDTCNGVIHVVKRGDTLYKLSRIYKVKLSDIISANPYINVYNMQPGDEVCIPVIMEEDFLIYTVQDGDTFEENAIIKAKTVMEATGSIVLADDSGLEIDYLNKEPGIYSSRYMGEDTSYTIKNQNLLDRLNGVPKEQRTARFVCAIAAVLPDKETLVTRETIEGYIGFEPQGENGFGYDPIFYVDEYNCSTASLPPDKKNEMSHRGKALRAMKEALMGKGLS